MKNWPSESKKNYIKTEHLKYCKWQTNSRKTNFLYEENKGFFWFLTLVGMCSFSFDKTGKCFFKFFSVASLSTVIILVALSSWAVYCVQVLTGHMKQGNFEFEETFFYMCFYAFPFLQIAVILFYFETGKFADYLNRWQLFHDRFESTTRRKFPSTASNMWIIAELMGLSAVLAFIAMYWDVYFNMIDKYKLERTTHIILISMFGYCTCIMATVAYFWFLLAGALKKAAGAIFSDIDSLNWTVNGSLNGHISLWLNLRQLCLKMGDVICATMVYMCLGMFIFTMPVLYVGARHVLQGEIHFLATSCHTLVYLSLLAEISHQAVIKVGNEFETKLTDLLTSKKASGHEKELVAFIHIVATNPPMISMGGYFNFDRGINVPLLSSVATYMAIILQYSEVK